MLILSATERTSLLAIPESGDDFIRYYTFNEPDLSRSGSAGGDANRLGFAVQLCLLRLPRGYTLASDVVMVEPIPAGYPPDSGGCSRMGEVRRGR